MKVTRILLVANRMAMASGKSNFSSKPAPDNGVFWRESATLLIARQSSLSPLAGETLQSKSNVEFLSTTRAKQAKFMGGGVVFPGGVVSSADSSNLWLDLFAKYNKLDSITLFECLEPGAHRPEIYSGGIGNLDTSSKLRKEVSLRITAIRETFEECGLLFGTPADSEGKPAISSNSFINLPENVIVEWQKRVRSNPNEFVKFFDELKCLPNLAALYEWSNWLTPVTYKPGPKGVPRRFDTMFYITILPSSPTYPKIVIDPYEVESSEWASPTKLIADDLNGTHRLMPPQKYEMGRLHSIKNTNELNRLIKVRQKKGIARWCPQIFRVKDGKVGYLPGDELMIDNQDIYSYSDSDIVISIDKTIDELTASTSLHNRWNLKSETGVYSLLVNTYKLGQIYTMEELELDRIQDAE